MSIYLIVTRPLKWSESKSVIYRCFQLAILFYILFEVIYNQRYLKTEAPVPAAVRITLQAPNNFANFAAPSYCNVSLPCTFWGANEVQFPSDGAGVAFFTTRASALNYPNLPGCNPLRVTSPSDPCFFSPTNNNVTILPKSYIGGIENYTMMIEHSIRGKATSIAIRNGLMDGHLYDSNGKLIKTMTNSTRIVENPSADGDIFTVQEFLSAAGADLDAPSTAPGANKAAGETYRSSGIVIAVVIEYLNAKYQEDQLYYNYRPRIIDGNEYKVTENLVNGTDGSVTLVDRHGIRFVFQQTGTIGVFDFVTLLTALVASFTLLKVAEIIVEQIMLRFLPEKQTYEEIKFVETEYKRGEGVEVKPTKSEV
ncbi:939_t:CDS:10 [Dentiscutata erythropus]|uniref:939_t:CDS:1 n=1 Tax=Dentiscutata erythropus TaxID=1348616 RepID=A0A9N8Z6F1_9GLOM|nr:939_t:CDS:10 [Dentiscutata erythropus]